MSVHPGDHERTLLQAQSQLLAATAALARGQTREEVIHAMRSAVRDVLGFSAVTVLTRGGSGDRAAVGHVVPLGDLMGVLLVDDPDDRPLSLAARLGLLRVFADSAGATLAGVGRLEASRAQARHDTLTQLPNRAALLERLGVAIARARREQGRLAVLFLDLDGFKAINDSFGHSTGDALLRGVAERLVAQLRPQDTVARYGGDEFVVVCEELEAPADADAIVARLLEALSVPVEARDQTLRVGASIGLALGDGNSTPATLVRAADGAMYAAKTGNRRKSTTLKEPSITLDHPRGV